MYFFHAQLFPARAAPHDIYGAADVHLTGRWMDLPADLRLARDRYETSRLSELPRAEVNERWQMSVRSKLLSGEVALAKRKGIASSFKLQLRGGVLKLSHGEPRQIGTSSDMSYPIQALLTIVSTQEEAEWTLLSLEVRVQAKTGEFNHQLEASNRQRYDLHRLAALAMTREEARARKINSSKSQNDSTIDEEVMPRPLNALFEVAHTFSLSWQLELLSAQAQALRRGAWSAGEGSQINVTPVRFLDDDSSILGAVSVSFWRVDDSYGPPSLYDLSVNKESPDQTPPHNNYRKFINSTNQLVLLIRAEKSTGIKVSLSGGKSIQEKMDKSTNETIQNLLDASSNPFSLSVSDALLAATRLCAERKCEATVNALQPPTEGKSTLPSWMALKADRGNISVAARFSYHGIPSTSTSGGMPVLFRLACDARTGSFALTFPRNMKLLRHLACNDIEASESLALRIANTPANRRRAAGSRSTGRLVKETFDGLIRSMNVLGQRVGVGGSWEDKDEQSASIRTRAISLACRDVSVSLTKCCGVAALFGLAPIAFSTGLGLNACPDMAGEAIESALDGISLFPVPPLSVTFDRHLIETQKSTSDGVKVNKSYIQQKMFAMSFGISDSGLTMYPLDIEVSFDNPASVPLRKFCTVTQFVAAKDDSLLGYEEPVTKKMRLDENGSTQNGHITGSKPEPLDPMHVAGEFAAILHETVLAKQGHNRGSKNNAS